MSFRSGILRNISSRFLFSILLCFIMLQIVFITVVVQDMFFGKQVSFSSQSVHITVLKFADTKEQNENLSNLRYSVLRNITPENFSLNSRPRKDRCNNCFKHNFTYLIKNEVCKIFQGLNYVELLLLVTSHPANIVQRQALRDTWLTYSRNNTANVRYIFLFGNVNNSTLQDAIIAESNTFHDILQENFIDSYENLTYKTIMGFKWAVTNCRSAKFIMKTDDDMYVNVPEVVKLARANARLLQTTVIGNCSLRAKPNRDTESRWYVSRDSYPGQYYPGGYCSGTGYVTSMKVVSEIYKISPHVPYFHLEDVYTSFCVRRLGYNLKSFSRFYTKRSELGPCLYKTSQVVTSHYMDAESLKSIWSTDCNHMYIYD